MTRREPQHRIQVEVVGAGADHTTATCFFSTWTEDDGDPRWRGFLAAISPPGSAQKGPAKLRLASGEEYAIEIRDVRTAGREQAVFEGSGAPPPVS